MTKIQHSRHICTVCGKEFPKNELVSGALVRNTVADVIRKNQPEWSPEKFICREDRS